MDGTPVDRRGFVTLTASTAAALSCGVTAAQAPRQPNAAAAADPPGTPCGVSSGDVTHDAAVVWSRTDRPARMVVEYATTEDFRRSRRTEPVAATPETDFTAKALVTGLPPGQTILYRASHVTMPGSLRTSPAVGSTACSG
jgi:alkaline phosphatase D